MWQLDPQCGFDPQCGLIPNVWRFKENMEKAKP
jgi:hypothetical protein